MTNPLLDFSGVPDFGAINPADFPPALDDILGRAKTSLAMASGLTEPPTLANLIQPLEDYRREVETLQNIAAYYASNFRSPQISAALSTIQQRVSAFEKGLFQDPALGERFRELDAAKDHLPFTPWDLGILRYYRQQFEAAGAGDHVANTPGAAARLKDVDDRLIAAASDFSTNLMAGVAEEAVHVSPADEAQLAGLENFKAGFAEGAKAKGLDGWLIPATRMVIDGMLPLASDETLQNRLYQAGLRVAAHDAHDNKPVIERIRAIRQEYVDVLGPEYPDYAHFAASRSASGSLERVDGILQQVEERLLPQFNEEMAALEQFARKKLTPANVSYWAEQQKKALHDFDEGAFMDYLDTENVLTGVLGELSAVFEVDFTRRPEGTYGTKPGVIVYDMVHRPTGKQSVVLVDLYAREDKRSGAWEEPIVAAGPGRTPVFTLCANASPPANGERGKLSLSNYRTLWHEFGHLMNCVLSQDVPYPSHRNIENGPTDRAEVHSTMNEKRGFSREIIKKIARKDGLPPDDDLLDKMEAAQNHMAIWTMLRLVQNARRDIAAHMPEKYSTLQDVAENTRLDSPYADLLRPNTFETFHHLFEKPHSPYAGRFYSYLIARIRAVGAWEPFKENGLRNPAWLGKMRKTLYASGVGGDDATFMADYLGKEETLEPFLQSLGVRPQAPNSDAPPRPAPG